MRAKKILSAIGVACASLGLATSLFAQDDLDNLLNDIDGEPPKKAPVAEPKPAAEVKPAEPKPAAPTPVGMMEMILTGSIRGRTLKSIAWPDSW